MSLNYNFIDTLKLLVNSLKYEIMISLIIGISIFIALLIINEKNKKINYIICIINILVIIIISLYYMKGIISFKFSNPINNIYFYFLNSIIYLITMCIINFKIKYKKINFIIYGISLINILFSIFMTYYLNNNTFIVIGNIYPMIKFGNIIYFCYYIFLISIIIIKFINVKIYRR